MIHLDDLIPGSAHFKWREALWLPTWAVHVFPTDTQRMNIIQTAKKMDAIRNRLGKPVLIECWLRPKKYNTWKKPYGVGGAENSAHIDGYAVDFKVVTMNADDVRATLVGKLEMLEIRMEDLPFSSWVHIDLKPVNLGGNRYFKP